jgi:hypothetical protein
MKGEIRKSKNVFAIVAMILFCLCFSETANGQSAKRKRKRASRPVTTTASIILPQTEPEIISRAEDDQNQNQVIIQPTLPEAPPETFDDKIDKINTGVTELKTRVKSLETTKTNEYDEKQKRLLLNLDILTRAETRSETLRKQLFDMIDRENQIKTKLDQIENDIRPEMLERSVAFAGSLRPEELRDNRRKNLEVDRRNLQNLLTEIQNTKASLELNVQKADTLVEKLRFRLEKEIDKALADEPNP